MMKNYEKYAEEIREYEGNNFCRDFTAPYILKSNECNLNDCGLCNMLQMLWLLEDYKEPEVDWSKVEVDTPILVRYTEDDEWEKRYFADYDAEYEVVYAWVGGRTSWNETDMNSWEYAKLAESEEGGVR